MSEISVECETSPKGWTCRVTVKNSQSQSQHTVEVPREDYQELTGGSLKPESLVKKSFEFLLEREPKESILGQFDLMTIARYFPDYPDVIKDRL